MKKQLPLILSIAIVLTVTSVSLACPMCKDSIPSSDAQLPTGLPSGFNNSVYLMLIGLFAVMGTTCAMIVKAVRQTGK